MKKRVISGFFAAATLLAAGPGDAQVPPGAKLNATGQPGPNIAPEEYSRPRQVISLLDAAFLTHSGDNVPAVIVGEESVARHAVALAIELEAFEALAVPVDQHQPPDPLRVEPARAGRADTRGGASYENRLA